MLTIKRQLTISLALMVALTSSSYGQERSEEYRLKALVISRVLGFVDWPDSDTGEQLQICVAGESPFASSSADAFSEFNVDFSMLGPNPSAESYESCQLLFIAESERRRVAEMLDQLQDKPVLTISDLPRFAEDGGIIGLTFINRRVGFQINQKMAESAGIKLSFQLLSLAEIVGGS